MRLLLLLPLLFQATTALSLGSSGDGSTRAGATLVLETERLLFVHKPAGMQFHSVNTETPDDDGLLGNIRAGQLDGSFGSYQGEGLFAVHRLDAVTSGLVLFAKDSDAAGRASRAFQRRGVDKASPRNRPLLRKRYIALASKKVKQRGKVVGDLRKSRRGAWKLTRTLEDPSRTLFWSAGVLPAKQGQPSPGEQTRPASRLVVLEPQTGRTHQLRCVMRSLGAPIIGDALYSGDAADRCYLHAASLEIDAAELGLAGPGEGVDGVFSVRCPPATGGLWAPAGAGGVNANGAEFEQLWDAAVCGGLL